MNVVIAGRGRVGRGLARSLQKAGVEVTLVSGRASEPGAFQAADVVVLAVPDDAIAACAERIAPELSRGTAVLHCAGARDAGELAACRAAGMHVGVMHPLASFADAQHPPKLEGATFVIAGDAYAVTAAQDLAGAVGGVVLRAAIHGPAYHALAALAANGTVGLAHAAAPALEKLGLSRSQAERALAALLRTVADNVGALGVPRALTGPVMRGDAATVAAHREALAEMDVDAAAAYDAMLPVVLRCARAAGLSEERADAIARAVHSEPSSG